MIIKKQSVKAGCAGFIAGTALVLTLTGCTAYVQGPQAGVYVAPPVVEVGVPATYVYYPNYDVYYNPDARMFVYLDGGAWVTRPEPRDFSVDVVLRAPSVRMDFHDSPANHHAEVVRRYAPNHEAAHGPQGQRAEPKPQARKAPPKKPNQKDEKHEEHP